jgi:hypothetical protein
MADAYNSSYLGGLKSEIKPGKSSRPYLKNKLMQKDWGHR